MLDAASNDGRGRKRCKLAGALLAVALWLPRAAPLSAEVRIEGVITLEPAFGDPPFAATAPLAVETSPTSGEINAAVLTDEGATNGLRTVRCTRAGLSRGSVFNDWVGGKYSCALSGNVLGNHFGLAERLVRRESDGHYFTAVTGLNPGGTRFCPKRLRFDATMTYLGSACIVDDVSSISNSLAVIGNQLCNASYAPSLAAVRVHCAPLDGTGDPAFALKATVDGAAGPDSGRPHFRIAPFFHPPTGQDWILVFYTRSGTTILDVAARRLSDGSLAGLPAGGFLDVRVVPFDPSLTAVYYGNGSAVDFTLLRNFAQPGATQQSGTWLPAGEAPAGGTIVALDITRRVGTSPTPIGRLAVRVTPGTLAVLDRSLGGAPGPLVARVGATNDDPLAAAALGLYLTYRGLGPYDLRIGAVDPSEVSSDDFETGRIRFSYEF